MAKKLIWVGVVVAGIIGVIMFNVALAEFPNEMVNTALTSINQTQFPEATAALRWSPIFLVFLLPLIVGTYAVFYILRQPEAVERIKDYMRRG